LGSSKRGNRELMIAVVLVAFCWSLAGLAALAIGEWPFPDEFTEFLVVFTVGPVALALTSS
jgi:hypothetical protein